MTKTYEVLMSTTYGEWVEVEADNKDQAIEKVRDGDWEKVTDSDVVDRMVTGDWREV